jgi:hypothetical protein
MAMIVHKHQSGRVADYHPLVGIFLQNSVVFFAIIASNAPRSNLFYSNEISVNPHV